MLKNAIAFIKIFTKFKKIKAEDKSFSFEVYKRIIKNIVSTTITLIRQREFLFIYKGITCKIRIIFQHILFNA